MKCDEYCWAHLCDSIRWRWDLKWSGIQAGLTELEYCKCNTSRIRHRLEPPFYSKKQPEIPMAAAAQHEGSLYRLLPTMLDGILPCRWARATEAAIRAPSLRRVWTSGRDIVAYIDYFPIEASLNVLFRTDSTSQLAISQQKAGLTTHALGS